MKTGEMNKCPKVGGQAVIEGVMMRSPNSLVVAVKRPNGQIVVREDIWRPLWSRLKFLRWPFLRGSVVMIEAMINGMQALNFSANEAMSDVEEKKKNQGKESEGMSGIGFVLTIAVGMLIAIGLFKMVPHLAATYTGKLFFNRALTVNDISYHVVDGVVKICIFVGYVATIALSKDIARVFMFHGAEHMSIYTLEAQEELTVENAHLKSTLHPRCGTAFIMVVIIVFIIIAAVTLPFIPEWAKPGPDRPWYTHVLVVLFKLPLLIPVAGVAYEFNRFAGRHADNPFLAPLLWPGLAMQLLTTRRPTVDQIEVALISLRMVLWRERVGEDVPLPKEPIVFEDFDTFVTAFPEVKPIEITS